MVVVVESIKHKGDYTQCARACVRVCGVGQGGDRPGDRNFGRAKDRLSEASDPGAHRPISRSNLQFPPPESCSSVSTQIGEIGGSSFSRRSFIL